MNVGILSDSMVKFTLYDVNLCLFDEERTEYFSKALKKVVRPGSIVVDAGSGTGVMGLLAAKYGAAKVYCIELSERFCNIIKENAKINGLLNKIVVINADASIIILPEKVDLIVAEIISGGFFFEPQIQVMNNLRKFLKKDGGVIPEQIDNYIELIDAQEELYGLKFVHDSRFIELDDTVLTDKSLAVTANFNNQVSPNISINAKVKGLAYGIANALKISYEIKLAGGIFMKHKTKFLLNPEVIFLSRKIKILPGKLYSIKAKYRAASDTLDLKINVR